MSTLWLLPKWPYPAIDGAMRAHMALIEGWPRSAGPLDLVAFSTTPPSQQSIDEVKRLTGAREVLILPTAESSRAMRVLNSVLSQGRIPATVMRFNGTQAWSKFLSWSETKSWENLVIDGIHAAGLFRRNGKWQFPKAERVILRAHNVESDLWAQSADKATGPLKWVLSREHELMAAFQDDLVESCDLLVPVSEIDARAFYMRVPHTKIATAAIGFDWPAQALATSTGLNVLFVGRLDWPPNSEGLEWFLREVWPQAFANRPELRLDVVGGFASSRLQALCADTAGVTAHGMVPELEPFYERCALSIIPILTGSGTRVKAIESAKFGRTLLSTSKGIEGVPLSPGQDYLLAESSAEWIQRLSTLDREQVSAMSQSIFANARELFDRTSIQNELLREINALPRTRR